MDSWVLDINEPATMYSNGEASSNPQIVAKRSLSAVWSGSRYHGWHGSSGSSVEQLRQAAEDDQDAADERDLQDRQRRRVTEEAVTKPLTNM